MNMKAAGYGLLAGMALAASPVSAQDHDLAKQLANPISSLISLPYQYNHDTGYGPADGHKSVLNVQPVIPLSVNDNWNVVWRTIIPFVDQKDIAGESGRQTGLGDIQASFFFVPKQPGKSGITWGVGPIFLLPTATDELLGGEKWGIGPTGVLLKQTGPWTVGVMANHVWSVAGADDRDDISSTFLQPFLTHTANSWTIALNTEAAYDWKHKDWSVPVNLQVSKLTHIGQQPISFQLGARYWADTPEIGPKDNWGLRASVTWLFPKG